MVQLVSAQSLWLHEPVSCLLRASKPLRLKTDDLPGTTVIS